MSTRLPNLIDPLLLAERNAEISGQLRIAFFDRLADFLAETQGEVEIDLIFGKDGNLGTINGHITATLALICQRCLEPLAWQVNKKIRLGIVESLEQANKLPEGYDPLLFADDDKISLKSIIEDELLLSIPDAPKHGDNCRIPGIPGNNIIEMDKDTAIARKPFSILADFKKTGDKNGSTKK